jgi:hypothetical protein
MTRMETTRRAVYSTVVLLFVLSCQPETRNVRPLPFDLTLGKKIDEIRADVRKRFGSDETTDMPVEGLGRCLLYMLEAPESPIAINVRYCYRAADRVVWNISVANASQHFTGDLGGVELDDTLDDVIEKLGKPAARHQEAPVIDAFWWDTPKLGYQINAYSEEYGMYERGDVHQIEVWRRDLAPAGYRADRP